MSEKAPEEKPVAKKSEKSSGLRTVFLLTLILAALLALLNIFLNREDTQKFITHYLDEHAQIGVNYKDLNLNLFTGTLAGDDIAVDLRKNRLNLSLKEFTIHFNPLYLIIGTIKINAVIAKQIALNTSELIKSEKKTDAGALPQFLRHLEFNRADIEEFFWEQGDAGYLYVEKVRIVSKFGTLFYRSPTALGVRNLRYIGNKIHVFADRIEQDGFFIFNLGEPRMLDESKITSRVSVKNLLLSISKKRKPWLTNPGWDEDLNPTLEKYYGPSIPDDRSYFFVKRFYSDFEKTETRIVLNTLRGTIHDADLKGNGSFNRNTGIVNLKLKTDEPISFTKLPLGQAQIRQAFDKFSLDLTVHGTAQSLSSQKLKTDLKLVFIGNRINPDQGDVNLDVSGTIENTVAKIAKVESNLGGGKISGKGEIRLKELVSDLSFTCNGVETMTVVRLFSTITIPALADCSGTLSGSLKDPRLKVAMTSQDAGYEFLHFGPARGDLSIENSNLKLEVQSTSTEVGSSRLTLVIKNVFDNFKQITELDTQHQNLDVRKLLNAKSLDGNISGNFSLKRVNNINEAKGDFNVKSFRFFEHMIGDLNTTLALKNKHLSLKPITIDLDRPDMVVTSSSGFEFDFDAAGYRFVGSLLPQLSVKGDFKKADRNHLNLKIEANDLPLKMFSSLMPFEPRASSLTGSFDAKYHLYDPLASQMQSSIKKLLLELPEGNLELVRASTLGYASKAFQFKTFEIREGNGLITLNGALGLAANNNLNVKGKVDFDAIADFNPFISESEQPIDVDLTFKGEFKKPGLFGKIVFNNDTLTFRNVSADISEISGTVAFDGNRIAFKDLNLLYDDAPVELDGFVTTDFDVITGGDAKITGSEVPIHLNNGMNLLADLDLALKGSGTTSVTGKINIVEGQYNRDFGLTNFIVRPREPDFEEEAETKLGILSDRTQLHLSIKNTGDFTIKNNLAELEMQADLEMTGSISQPALTGQVDFVSGEINAFGVDFEDATGYAQFKKGDNLNPDVNLIATKGIQEYEIKARVQGRADNLRLRLDSTPTLDRRDIVALLFYGQTPDQLVGDRRREFTQTAAISQLASVLAKPINKISGLDVVEVSGRQEGTNQTVQRLSVGKKLSNRLNFLFTTDLGIEDPERAFELEYQVFDHFYTIVAKDVGDKNRYRLEVSYKFETY